MKKGKLLSFLLVSLCVFLLIGCSKQSGETSSSNSSAPSNSTKGAAPIIVIGESSPIASNPNQQAITKGEIKAAEQLGWTVKTLDANLSSDKQISDIDTLITKKVNGILTWTLNPGAADAAYKRASDAGIPVLGYNSNSTFFATKIVQETDVACTPEEQAAAYIKEKSPGAKVLVVGAPPVESAQLRVSCFLKAAKANGLEVVAQQDNLQDTAAAAQPLVENMLTKYPDVKAIWAYNDPSALGAAAVVQTQKKHIMIFGVNGSQEAIDAIKKGMLTATWDTNSPDAGAAAIAVLAKHIKDGVPLADLPKTVTIPTQMWESSNVDKYVPWNDRPVTLTLP